MKNSGFYRISFCFFKKNVFRVVLFLLLLSALYPLSLRAQVNSGVVPHIPHPEDNSAPKAFIPAQNPFYPNLFNDPSACRNKSPHRLANESDRSVEIKLSPGKQFNAIDIAKMVDSKNSLGGTLGKNDKQEAAYVVFTLPKRMAITKVGIAWHDEKGFSGAGSVEENFGSGYLLATGFGTNPTISDESDPTCRIGEMLNVSADSLFHEYELGPYPVKADYVVLKKSQFATPSSVSIGELKIWGVAAEQSIPFENNTVFKGKITVQNARQFPVFDAKLYDITKGEKNKTLLGITDADGNFQISTITPNKKSYRLLIEREGFESQKINQTIKIGLNEKSFTLRIAGPNLIKGVARDRGFRGVPNIFILAQQDGQTVGVTKTDKKGNYRIEVPNEGQFSLRALSNRSIDQPQFSGKAANVSFAAAEGGELIRNIETTPPPPANTRFFYVSTQELGAVDESTDENYGFIKGVSVKIFKGKDATGEMVWQGTSPDVIELPNGIYTAVAIAPGYNQVTDTVDTTNLPNVVKNYTWIIDLRAQIECLPSPRKNVANTIVCGKNAQSLLGKPDFEAKLNAIDLQIGRLRQQYGYTDLPTRLRISATSDYNAFFRGEQSLAACPPKKSPEKDEMIFNLGLLEKSGIPVIEHATAHEWGHGKDYRISGCSPLGQWRSYEEDFATARLLAERYSKQIYKIETGKQHPKDAIAPFYSKINDSRYDADKKGGHSEDNETETYASLFHDAVHHRKEVVAQFSTTPPTALNKNKQLQALYTNLNRNFHYMLTQVSKTQRDKQ